MKFELKKGNVVVSFDYHPGHVQTVREIATASGAVKPFDPDTKTWTMPVRALPALASEFPEADGDYAEALAKMVKQKEREAELSRFIMEACFKMDRTTPDGRVLYQHQLEGVKALCQQRKLILADDMGLGKTLTALTAAKAIHKATEARTIVLCPASLVQQWQREARAMSLPAAVYSWAKVPSMPNGVSYCLIADEAHAMQSMKSQRTKAALGLADNALAVFLLTGTPMRNGRPANLFPLLKAIGHPLGQRKSEYEKRFCGGFLQKIRRKGGDIHVWNATGATNLDELRELVKRSVLRRTKAQCLDLPPKTRVLRDCEISEEAMAHYKMTVARMEFEREQRVEEELIDDEGKSLVRLNVIRKAASIAKVPTAIEIAEDTLDAGGQIVLFSAFVETARAVAKHFGVTPFVGELPPEARPGVVDRFQAGKDKVFSGTIGAGGLGLTLTAAATVVLIDRPLTPGDAEQAEDRAYRIGTHWPVTSYWLRAFSVDVWTDRLLTEKSHVTDQLLSGTKLTGTKQVSASTLLRQILKAEFEQRGGRKTKELQGSQNSL